MAKQQRVTEVREVVPEADDRATHSRAVDGGPAPANIIAKRIVYYITGVIIALLLLRIILLLLAANQGNAFVDLVYAVSGFFAAPFYGIFNYTPSYGSSVFEISSVVAIIVYWLIGWGIAKLFTLGSRRTV